MVLRGQILTYIHREPSRVSSVCRKLRLTAFQPHHADVGWFQSGWTPHVPCCRVTISCRVRTPGTGREGCRHAGQTWYGEARCRAQTGLTIPLTSSAGDAEVLPVKFWIRLKTIFIVFGSEVSLRLPPSASISGILAWDWNEQMPRDARATSVLDFWKELHAWSNGANKEYQRNKSA